MNFYPSLALDQRLESYLQFTFVFLEDCHFLAQKIDPSVHLV
jgi:hypothetical protein